MTALHGVSALAAGFADATLDPVELCERYLARIAAHDAIIHAFVSVDTAGARTAAAASAARWRRAAPLSPIDGVAIAVKANIAVANWPFHAGIASYRDRIAARDATCIARLRAQGAVLLGLVNMHEAALGATTDNPAFGRTENPWAPGRTAGGSSGGSAAAVAAGFCAAALGTDTLGSVRIPSAYCGVFGHKPAAGTMPLDGIEALSPSYDQLGVHAHSVADCALLVAALTCQPLTCKPPGGRLAVLRVDGQVAIARAPLDALEHAAERACAAGYTLHDLRLTALDYGALRRRAFLVIECEAERCHRSRLAADPEGFSPELRAMLSWAAAQPNPRVAQARAVLADTAAELARLAAEFTAILAPTTPHQAFTWQEKVPTNQADVTALASIAGLAAIAVPAGRAGGLPLSVQVIGATDEAVLTAAAAIADVTRTGTPACAFP